MSAFDPARFATDHNIPEGDLEAYPLDGCERRRRGGGADYPYQGCSVWLLPDTPLALLTAGTKLSRGDESGIEQGFAGLAAGLAQIVAGHDIPGMGQWYGDPAAVEAAPATLLTYVLNIALTGEVPEARPNSSESGPNGNSTRQFSARTTRPGGTARHRPANG